MTWRDLLFAHWPVPAASLRPVVPRQFEIEKFDHSAWIAVVPFLMTGLRLGWMPPAPGLSRTLELNLRTYVRHGPHSGVYFFSLDAQSWPAVIAARIAYALPYFHAHMRQLYEGDAIRYESRRSHLGAPGATLIVRCRPVGDPYLSLPGSLEHWLTERYTFFTANRSGAVIRGDIRHARWPLQRAEAEFQLNAMTAQIGLRLPDERPLLHFVRRLDVMFSPPSKTRRPPGDG
jgi:uncharacterized protein YqjF (DUF2071 family)